jgi:hypothetical protein
MSLGRNEKCFPDDGNFLIIHHSAKVNTKALSDFHINRKKRIDFVIDDKGEILFCDIAWVSSLI